MTLDQFNRLPAQAAVDALLSCCDSHQWARQVAAGRPYRDQDALLAAGDARFAALPDAAVDAAIAAHPRIGERARDSASRDAAWSREEQAEVATAQHAHDELAAVNAAYEQRFGRVFLICATGLSARQVLAEARRRLTGEPASEWAETVRELTKIVRLRLGKLVDG